MAKTTASALRIAHDVNALSRNFIESSIADMKHKSNNLKGSNGSNSNQKQTS